MTETSIRLVKEQVTPEQAIEYYTHQQPKRKRYLCPFHNDRNPSLTVKGTHWQCWSCGANGDVISFVQNYFHITFPEAVCKLADDFGISIPEEQKPTSALDKLYRFIEQENREHIRNGIKAHRAEVDSTIDKLTTAHRVLAQHGASAEILRGYADEIDRLIRYRDSI